MLKSISRIEVIGLFGRLDHDIEIRSSEPTILTAPNGAGKTHVLTLVDAALSQDAGRLIRLPFEKLRIHFGLMTGLSVERYTDDDGDPFVCFSLLRMGAKAGKEVTVDADDVEAVSSDAPNHLVLQPNGQWYDRRLERIVPRSIVLKRYPSLINGEYERFFRESPDITALCKSRKPVLIDTKRLDALHPSDTRRVGEASIRPGTASAARINQYINELQAQVEVARRNSIQATQSADLSFAARALAAASQTVKEGPLHARYDQIVSQYEDLARNSLAIGEAPMDFPEKTTPTVRRILNVFLDDWENRLKPLIPLNEKIKTLRQIVDSKFAQSGKRTAMSAKGGMVFRTFDGNTVRVSSLSSGEQHLVALYTMLLFSARTGSLVLMDEPEISLHAAWKHAFLEDISRVGSLMKLQVLIATHSTAIINGRWDLAEELSFGSHGEVNDRRDESENDSELDDLIE